MKDYFVQDNYNNVKSFKRLRDAREYADAIGGYNPGWLITSLDHDDGALCFAAAKNFAWSRTSEDIRKQARAALKRNVNRLRRAILAAPDVMRKFAAFADKRHYATFLRTLCKYALGREAYNSMQSAYCCGELELEELCGTAITGTNIGKVFLGQ